MKYKVIRDTREQQGWHFPAEDRCEGTHDQKLRTGDYSLEGFEDYFVIERKGTCLEFAQNLSQKRFWNELARLEKIPHPFIICEFNFEELWSFPFGQPIPKTVLSKIRVRGPYLLKRLTELMIEHGIQVIFAGRKGMKIAESLFKRMAESGTTD